MRLFSRLAFPLSLGIIALSGYISPQDRQYVEYFLKLQSAELFRTKSFLLQSSNSYIGEQQLERIELQFSYYQILGINKARKLLVATAQELVEKINNDLALKERNLLPKPFTINQLSLQIHMDNIMSAYAESPTIKKMRLENGMIIYETFCPSKLMYSTPKIHSETFQYALMLLDEPTEFEEKDESMLVVVEEEKIIPASATTSTTTNTPPSENASKTSALHSGSSENVSTLNQTSIEKDVSIKNSTNVATTPSCSIFEPNKNIESCQAQTPNQQSKEHVQKINHLNTTCDSSSQYTSSAQMPDYIENAKDEINTVFSGLITNFQEKKSCPVQKSVEKDDMGSERLDNITPSSGSNFYKEAFCAENTFSSCTAALSTNEKNNTTSETIGQDDECLPIKNPVSSANAVATTLTVPPFNSSIAATKISQNPKYDDTLRSEDTIPKDTIAKETDGKNLSATATSRKIEPSSSLPELPFSFTESQNMRPKGTTVPNSDVSKKIEPTSSLPELPFGFTELQNVRPKDTTALNSDVSENIEPSSSLPELPFGFTELQNMRPKDTIAPNSDVGENIEPLSSLPEIPFDFTELQDTSSKDTVAVHGEYDKASLQKGVVDSKNDESILAEKEASQKTAAADVFKTPVSSDDNTPQKKKSLSLITWLRSFFSKPPSNQSQNKRDNTDTAEDQKQTNQAVQKPANAFQQEEKRSDTSDDSSRTTTKVLLQEPNTTVSTKDLTPQEIMQEFVSSDVDDEIRLPSKNDPESNDLENNGP